MSGALLDTAAAGGSNALSALCSIDCSLGGVNSEPLQACRCDGCDGRRVQGGFHGPHSCLDEGMTALQEQGSGLHTGVQRPALSTAAQRRPRDGLLWQRAARCGFRSCLW